MEMVTQFCVARGTPPLPLLLLLPLAAASSLPSPCPVLIPPPPSFVPFLLLAPFFALSLLLSAPAFPLSLPSLVSLSIPLFSFSFFPSHWDLLGHRFLRGLGVGFPFPSSVHVRQGLVVVAMN